MTKVYLTHDGREISLDQEELGLLALLEQHARSSDWIGMELAKEVAVAKFYMKRGKKHRSGWQDLPLARVADDLWAKVAVASGVARRPDYRDELLQLGRGYSSRKAFCEALGVACDQVQATLSRYGHFFSPGSLHEALQRIGCCLGVASMLPIDPAYQHEVQRTRVVKMRKSVQRQERVQALPEGYEDSRLIQEKWLGKDDHGFLALLQGLESIGCRPAVLMAGESLIIRAG